MSAQAAVLLLDIEGTVAPLDFVHRTLFPFARERMRDYLTSHRSDDEVRVSLRALVEENAGDLRAGAPAPVIRDASGAIDLESAAAYLEWLMDVDRKSTPLKALQGRIWEEGYRLGVLTSEVFPDVRPALERWRVAAHCTAIFSSGSVVAQKNFFSRTTAGDLSPFIEAYFDTTTGPKKESSSYARIAAELGALAASIRFVSDVLAELDAASAAGCATALCVRPGNPPQDNPHRHLVIRSFSELA